MMERHSPRLTTTGCALNFDHPTKGAYVIIRCLDGEARRHDESFIDLVIRRLPPRIRARLARVILERGGLHFVWFGKPPREVRANILLGVPDSDLIDGKLWSSFVPVWSSTTAPASSSAPTRLARRTRRDQGTTRFDWTRGNRRAR